MKSICALNHDEKEYVCGGGLEQAQYLCNVYRESDIDSNTKVILGEPLASRSFSDSTGAQCARFSQEQSNQLYKSEKLKVNDKLVWHCPKCV